MGEVRFVNVNNDKVYPLTRVLRRRNCRLSNSSVGRNRALSEVGNCKVPMFVKRTTRGVGNTRLIICSTTVGRAGPRERTTGGLNVPYVREDMVLNVIAEECEEDVTISNARNGAAAATVLSRILVNDNFSPSTVVNKGLPFVNKGDCINRDSVVIYRTYRCISAFLRLGPFVSVVLGVSTSRLSCFGGLSGVGGSFGGFTRRAANLLIVGNSSRGALSTMGSIRVRGVACNFNRGYSCETRGVDTSGNIRRRFSLCCGNRGLARVGLVIPKGRGVCGTLTTTTATRCLNTAPGRVSRGLRGFNNIREEFRVLNAPSKVAITSSFTRRPARLATALGTTVGVNFGGI